MIAVGRVPLAAQYPQNGERLTVHVLFAAQVVGAGLLFPFLLRGAARATQAIAVALPFQVAACALAGEALKDVLPAITFVGAWLASLALWATCLYSTRTRAIGIALASLLTLGGGTLRYLRLEWASSAGQTPAFESASPLLATFALIVHFPAFGSWILLTASACVATGILAARRASARGLRRDPAR